MNAADSKFYPDTGLRGATPTRQVTVYIPSQYVAGSAAPLIVSCDAYGARNKDAFASAVKLVVMWGFGFALAVAACFLLFGPALIDIMTASVDVRRIARDYLWFVIFAPLLGVFAFAYDGIYIGATWARDMRNLMLLSLLIFLGAWFSLRSFGNAGLWGAFLVHYAARGGLEALRYPALLRKSFGS